MKCPLMLTFYTMSHEDMVSRLYTTIDNLEQEKSELKNKLVDLMDMYGDITINVKHLKGGITQLSLFNSSSCLDAMYSYEKKTKISVGDQRFLIGGRQVGFDETVSNLLNLRKLKIDEPDTPPTVIMVPRMTGG